MSAQRFTGSGLFATFHRFCEHKRRRFLPQTSSRLSCTRGLHLTSSTLLSAETNSTKMNNLAILMVLVVCALLVTDSQAWFGRRRGSRGSSRGSSRGGGRGGGTITKLFTKGFVPIITTWMSRGQGNQAQPQGKRTALCADLLTPDQVQQLTTSLQNTCTDIGVNLAAEGLNLDEVKDVFEDSDADSDGVLLDAELEAFAAAIEVTGACAEIEAKNTK